MKYISCKIVEATPMTVQDDPMYAAMVGHEYGTEGYQVVYDTGYKSWCPKEEFEKNNRPVTEMTFGQAIEAMQQGHLVARRGWRTFHMHVGLSDQAPELPPAEAFEDGIIPQEVHDECAFNFFFLHDDAGTVHLNFGPSHTEMQSTDWFIWTKEDADKARAAHIEKVKAEVKA